MENILDSMGRVSRLTSLVTVMGAGLPKLLASSGYKSQRKSCTRRGKKRGEGGEATVKEKKKREWDSLWERKEKWESGEIVSKHKGEKRNERKKQTEQKQRTRWSREPSTTIVFVFVFSKSGMFDALLRFPCKMRWCMLVCKIQKENIRKPTPEIASYNALFCFLFSFSHCNRDASLKILWCH